MQFLNESIFEDLSNQPGANTFKGGQIQWAQLDNGNSGIERCDGRLGSDDTRTLANARDLMRRMRHLPVREQVVNLNRVLRGHYGYFGIAGNLRAMQKVYQVVCRRITKDRGSIFKRNSMFLQITFGLFVIPIIIHEMEYST